MSTAPAPVVLSRSGLTLEDVHRVAVHAARLEVEPGVWERLRQARAVIDAAIDGERLVYGLNTGLGHLCNERVSRELLARYQVDIIEEHATGLGAPLGDEQVRAIMLARVAGAARGGSGLHPDAVAFLVEMLNAGVHPVVPEIGSVGASDLMHMAAVALVMIGKGEARVDGRVVPAAAALERAGMTAYRPRPQDGLALVSANGASVGIGALTVVAAEHAAWIADAAAALTLDVLGGNPSPFDDEVAGAKPLAGQIRSAALVRDLLHGSSVTDRDAVVAVQDPLSLRVVPQVHGAMREQLAAARAATELELNSSGDNPYVSSARGVLISNGNFHPLALALAFETMRVAIAHVAMISERRMNKLAAAVWASERRAQTATQPPPDGAGRALVHYPAATLVAELKHLAAPVTIHCPPLDLDVEDHATLAPSAVMLTRRSLAHLERILATEVLMAVDLHRAGERQRRLGEGTQAVVAAAERACAHLGRDEAPSRHVDAISSGLAAMARGEAVRR